MQRKQDLENKIRGDWNELKGSLRPTNLARETFNKVFRAKTEGLMNEDSILKNALVFGASLLASKLAVQAGVKVSKIFRRKKSLMPSNQ